MNLDGREKTGLVFGLLSLALVVGLLIYIPLGPKKRYESTTRDLKQLRQRFELTREARSEQEALLRGQEALKLRLQGRSAAFDLYTFIDSTVKEARLADRTTLENVQPRRRDDSNLPTVRVTLENVSLEEVKRFLYVVYDDKNLVVMRDMACRPESNDKGLHCTLTFVTVKA